jgi:hypothetical protein
MSGERSQVYISSNHQTGTGMRIAVIFRIYITGSEFSFAFPSRLL